MPAALTIGRSLQPVGRLRGLLFARRNFLRDIHNALSDCGNRQGLDKGIVEPTNRSLGRALRDKDHLPGVRIEAGTPALIYPWECRERR